MPTPSSLKGAVLGRTPNASRSRGAGCHRPNRGRRRRTRTACKGRQLHTVELLSSNMRTVAVRTVDLFQSWRQCNLLQYLRTCTTVRPRGCPRSENWKKWRCCRKVASVRQRLADGSAPVATGLRRIRSPDGRGRRGPRARIPPNPRRCRNSTGCHDGHAFRVLHPVQPHVPHTIGHVIRKAKAVAVCELLRYQLLQLPKLLLLCILLLGPLPRIR
mmetsp:Transcript_69189/g.158861  ORF Transcript_69189/g.158861 Transcript_69189/m.158861 type:complete len:216 (+) Transcript_69189:117-764(+)